MLTFFYAPKSCALASHIILEESGAEYDPKVVDLASDRSEYLKINPRGTVPALMIEGTLLTENVAILSYVARRYPDARLIPTDAVQEAMCLSFLSWCSSSIHISFRMNFRPQWFTPEQEARPAIRAVGRNLFIENLQKIDYLLKTRKWLMGDQFTVADGYALVFYSWALIDEVPIRSLRAYGAFKNRMLERPAVRVALEREESVLLDV